MNGAWSESNEKCPTHQAPLHYFCKTCTAAVCADCAMFGQDHKGHEFEHLSSVYEANVE